MKSIKGLTLLFILFTVSVNTSSAQCYTDRHNTTLKDSWVSCQTRTSPNEARDRGHWLLYTLDERKTVKELKVWNINHPEHLSEGAKTIAIDYLDQDGNWAEVSSYPVAQASASAYYEGEDIELSKDFITDQILITITENYGGDCSGLAEVRFGVTSTSTSTFDIAEDHFEIEISPNPFTQFANVTVDDLENKTVRYEVINNLGQIISSQTINTQKGSAQFQIKGGGLTPGTYYLKIIDGNRISSRKLSFNIQ